MIEQRPMTLMQAITLDAEAWEELSMSELSLTDDEREMTARVWCWLLCVDADSPEGKSARDEALSDAGIVVAFNLPAAEFLAWFRREDSQCFDSTARTGSDAWAWRLMRRARGTCEAMGSLAAQQSLPRWLGD